MQHIPATPGPKYFSYRKGTPAPAQTFALVQHRTTLVESCIDSTLKLTDSTIKPAQVYTSRFWREAFQSITSDGRFLACDKNLGVRFITNAYYNLLAVREAHNYESQITDTSDQVLLVSMRARLLEIASTIGNEANKPKITYSKHGLMFLRADNIEPIVNNTADTDVFLAQLARYIQDTSSGDIERFKLPALRMTLKVHKPLKNGLIPTRPIIPTCGMPNFVVGQWLGRFMAKMARQIPWNLECSEDFIKFITDQSRSPRVASFDFSNLYGSEPVQDTLFLFACAIEEMTWHFDDPADKIIFTALRTIVTVPSTGGLQEMIGKRSSIFLLLLADQIQHTYATLEVDNKDTILRTSLFLAMGCPPVAPLSIITLAYLESRHIGKERCTHGMKRYIDDIFIDTMIISEELLRSAYPKYLTLNTADSHHFLDVTIYHDGNKHVTWPYIKEFAIVPLCYFSAHPYHTIRAAAKNELVRLLKRTTLTSAKPAWVEFWFCKYSHAKYPTTLLRNLIKEVIAGPDTTREKLPRGINHVETWRGTKTNSARDFTKYTGNKVATAWKAAPSLLSIALKAHIQPRQL